ncbi:ventricular zone-expressed PH domain-containing protein homolog 1-like [Leucoraja erinacea]|uniref:ventricular zone-expressed PH domain-containing protein homolog 1-like n=1 Tax=Leucoraja erinaceus TaxID=7782 RepID=UPI0024573E22|nr:ventricular zone-expressed PH domain-containing protein homolog 1-like [Leucoraja erinacea]
MTHGRSVASYTHGMRCYGENCLVLLVEWRVVQWGPHNDSLFCTAHVKSPQNAAGGQVAVASWPEGGYRRGESVGAWRTKCEAAGTRQDGWMVGGVLVAPVVEQHCRRAHPATSLGYSSASSPFYLDIYFTSTNIIVSYKEQKPPSPRNLLSIVGFHWRVYSKSPIQLSAERILLPLQQVQLPSQQSAASAVDLHHVPLPAERFHEPLSSQDASVRVLKALWEKAQLRGTHSFETAMTQTIHYQKDLDSLQMHLAEVRFFDLFGYSEEVGRWQCFMCNNPEKAAVVNEDGQPLIEGKLKEKQKDDPDDCPIELSKVQSVKVIAKKRRERGLPRAFEIFTDNKTYIFKAKDEKNAEEWLQCINVAVAQARERENREATTYL